MSTTGTGVSQPLGTVPSLCCLAGRSTCAQPGAESELCTSGSVPSIPEPILFPPVKASRKSQTQNFRGNLHKLWCF